MKTFEIIRKIYKHHSPEKTVLAIQEMRSSLKENFIAFIKFLATITVRITTFSLKIIIITLLPVALFIMISSKSGVIGGIRSSTVLSDSMEPKIPVGAVVIVRKSWPYKAGDIISFTNKDGITLTHRIVDKLSSGSLILYKVKGDANNAPDSELVPENSVIGKEVLFVPYIGRAAAFMRTLPGFIGFIIIPVVLFIAFELWNIKKEIELEVQKKFMARMGRT